MDTTIELSNLVKVFRLGVRLKRVDALRGISFSVPRGVVFGFLGPNGAGKTTTIKIVNGLIHPSSGSVSVFGRPVGSREVASRIGYMPEQPYFYDYLSGREILVFYGRLFGLGHKEAARRADELLDRMGLREAKDRAIRKYSKGMMQRVGLAQALMNDPELVILDEPMSGLDPIGRKEVRDLMADLKEQGKTLFFSSHILADIEMVCDQVAIVHRGRIIEEGSVGTLLARAGDLVEVLARGPDRQPPLEQPAPTRLGELWRYELPPGEVDSFLASLLESGGRVVSVQPRRATLEDLFVKEVLAHDSNRGLAA
jgi:ABC-2 type transport system ATP-binding protein